MCTASILALAFITPSARADSFQVYNVAWSGAVLSTPNSTRITGTVTLDLTTLPDPVSDETNIINDITNLSITVSGAGVNDGTYTKSDLTGTLWDTNSATINMEGDVLAQLVAAYKPILGTGDFNLFFAAPGPYANSTLQLSPDDILSERAFMTEFSPVTATPEPASLALLLGGLGVLGFAATRKRRLGALV